MQLNLSSYLFQSCHRKNVQLFSLSLFIVSFCAPRSHAQVNNFDYRILRSIAETRTPEKNDFFKFISKYNNPVCLAAPA
ncbi:MAG TPA: hypothetical protein VHD35_00615, partial [Chitinophagaceae bacterium]|nr:hypothetical protein [Chitinophagaceae bacterium]